MADVFQSFIRSLDEHVRVQCWRGRPHTALVTLRMLTAAQQALVMRLLFGPQPEHIAELFDMGVVCISTEVPGWWELQKDFGEALRKGLSQPDPSDWAGPQVLQLLVPKIEQEAIERWESVLQFVGDPDGRFGERRYVVDDRLQRTLKALGLVGKEQSKAGLHFVLADAATQLWTLLLGYIRGTGKEQRGVEDVADQLEIVCRLVNSQVHRKRVKSASVSPAAKKALKVAVSLGLVCQEVPTTLTRKLNPTHASGASAKPPRNAQEGWIIVENNFRVYAYTSSVSAMRILSIFVRLEYRLPNLVVGTITRQSARTALVQWGVSVEQLEAFIISNCHPKMRNNVPIVPDAISDALRSWEAESRRLDVIGTGVLLDTFPSKDVFDHSVRWCKQNQVHLWSKPWEASGLGGLLFVSSADGLTEHLRSLDLEDNY